MHQNNIRWLHDLRGRYPEHFKNKRVLELGGLIIGCHGAEGNLHHGPDPWKPVPYSEFLDFCLGLPINVIEAFFEEERYGPDCAGAYDWLLSRADDGKWVEIT